MAHIREACRKMDKQIYWTEFAAQRHQFFKIMIGDFRNQLRIPRKFVRNFREKLSGTIKLKGPSRNVWKVKIAEATDDVLFLTGWGTFVHDHNLAEGDFLVFCYNENSFFNVVIFDDTGCERESAYFVKKHTLCSNNGCFLQKKETSMRSNNGYFHQKKAHKNVGIKLESVGEKVQEKKLKVERGKLRKEMQERNLESGIENETSKINETTAISQKKKNRNQSKVQLGVTKRFQSTNRESSRQSRKRWNGKEKLTTKKDEMVVTQKTPEVLDLTCSISKQGNRKKDKMEVIYISHIPPV